MPPPPSQLIPGLPDDVALWCLARVPKSNHPILSLVSKSWHQTLLSPSLFTTRSLLHVSETFLYLNLRHHSTFQWYVLISKPNSQICLVPLPSVPIGTPFSRNAVKIQSLGKIHPSSSTSSIKIQSLESIDNSSSRNSIKIESLGQFDPIEIQSLGQIGNCSSSTSIKIEPLESTSDNSLSGIGMEMQSLGEIESSLSKTSIKKQSLESNDNSSSLTSIESQLVGRFGSSSTRTSKKLQPFGMSHLLNAPKRQPIGPAFAVLGSSIYLIGGSNNEIPSNGVWVFDCRFNVWEEGPRMRVGREFSAAGAVDGKIYVMGGCVVDNWARSMNWAEVFDPAKGFWEPMPSPIEVRDKWMHASAVIGGKVYAMADRGGVVYDVRKGEWGSVTKRLDLGWRGRAAVVGGVLYCYDYLGKIRGYVVEDDRWKELRGVDKGLPKFLCGATMVNFGGRLCVVWEGKSSGKEVEIMCAVIEVKKDVDGGLSGDILWSEAILAVPHSTSIVQCLVVEL